MFCVLNFPKNLVARLIGINIVHLEAISFELRLHSVYSLIGIAGIGYSWVAFSSISLCQWVIRTWPDGVGCLRALPIIIWLLSAVKKQALSV